MIGSDKTYKIVTAIACGIGVIFFACTCWIVWKNNEYAGGNHSFLFGASYERTLMSNRYLIPFGMGIPFCIPVLLRRNLFTFFLFACGVGMMVWVSGVVMTITD
jgi:hypothetical protein